MKKEALELVEELNDKVADTGLGYYLPWSFESYGWMNSCIKFMGCVIWTEDNDEREYIGDTDEQEPLINYIMRESQRILADLNTKLIFLL